MIASSFDDLENDSSDQKYGLLTRRWDCCAAADGAKWSVPGVLSGI